MGAEKAGSPDFPGVHRLWSLLDMVILEARPLLNLVFSMTEMERYLSKMPGKIFPELASELQAMSNPIIEE